VATNFHSPFGEIDIIAEDQDTVVFVEVKTRKIFSSAFPILSSITRSKQGRLVKTAQCFLKQRRWFHRVCRFDVAVVKGGSIEWTRNAFLASQ